MDPVAAHSISKFSRKNGESLSDFLKRGEKLSRRCPDSFRYILASRTLENMVDGEKGFWGKKHADPSR